MSEITAIEIVQQMNLVRARDFPTARAKPEAMSVELLGPVAIAVLAMVSRWGWYGDLGKKVGSKTIRELIAEATDLTSPGTLERALADLAGKGMLDVRKEASIFQSKITVAWSDRGADLCYTYLNRWGWELLYMALERSPFSHLRGSELPGFGTGPPLVGGPDRAGRDGWSSKDI